MPGVRAGPQPRADTMSLEPVSTPVLDGGQRERLCRWTVSPASDWTSRGHTSMPTRWRAGRSRQGYGIGWRAYQDLSMTGRRDDSASAGQRLATSWRHQRRSQRVTGDRLRLCWAPDYTGVEVST